MAEEITMDELFSSWEAPDDDWSESSRSHHAPPVGRDIGTRRYRDVFTIEPRPEAKTLERVIERVEYLEEFRREHEEWHSTRDLVEFEIMRATVPESDRGTRILNRGIRISGALFLGAITMLAVNVGLGLAGAYLASTCFLLTLYAYWRVTGKVILNPRYVIVGIAGTIGLALTALLAQFA